VAAAEEVDTVEAVVVTAEAAVDTLVVAEAVTEAAVAVTTKRYE